MRSVSVQIRTCHDAQIGQRKKPKEGPKMSKNITKNEARKELTRRHRDPETGRKVKNHTLRDTDARFNLPREEVLALRTPELKTLAGIGTAPAPVAVSTPVVPTVEVTVDGQSVWHTDRLSHPLYAAA